MTDRTIISDSVEGQGLRKLVYAAMFAALTAAGAFFTIPLYVVPITLQDFFATLSGLLLGAGAGALSQVVYVFIGLAGMPVFAGGKAGPGVLLGPTGGYLIGFILGAFTIGKLAETRRNASVLWLIAAGFAGHVVVYAVGATWLSFIAHISARKALTVGVLPFLPGDALKCVVAALLAHRIRRYSFMAKGSTRNGGKDER